MGSLSVVVSCSTAASTGVSGRRAAAIVDGGSRTFTFAYTTNPNYDGSQSRNFNFWMRRTVETLLDGTENILYCNAVGETMLKIVRSGTDEWYEFTRYDDVGRTVLEASSAAISGYNAASGDLLNYDPGTGKYQYLKDNEGLIRLREYFTTTGAGAAAGYLKSEKIKQGQDGTEVAQRELEYTAHSAGGVTVHPVSKATAYRNDDGSGAIETAYAYTFHADTTQVQQKTTTLPVVPTSQNGSGTANSFQDVFDEFGYHTWHKDERGFITRMKYDAETGALTQQIDDVDTARVNDAPTGWSTPTGGGLHLITDYESDDQGRITQMLGPERTIDLGGTATSIRTAQWTVYKDAENRTVIGRGFQKMSDSTFTLVNPVSVTATDKHGNVTDGIQATRASTAGKLQPTDSFPQSSYVRWTTHQYTDCCKLISTRVYHTIPTSGEGTSGTNYDQTDFGYDLRDRQNRVVSPGGTITFTVFDARSLPVAVYVGTDDTGATDTDPTGGGAAGNNMVLVTGNEYDGGVSGGDGNLTQQTQHVDTSTARVTTFVYDWRNRQTDIDGEIDFYQKFDFDNLNQTIKTERYDTTANGNLIGRQETKFDDLGRVYRTIRYAVDPATGTVGNSLTDNTWYDPAGNVLKQAPSGSKLFTKSVHDGLNRETKRYVGYDLDESGYSAAGDVTGDTILEQSETTYDAASNVIQTTSRQRFHNATGTGALNGSAGPEPKARVTYLASWFDGIGRNIAVANYGTHGGASFTRPATIPVRSDTVLVTTTTYGQAGNVEATIDPAGMQSRFEYDDAGRPTKVIENYVVISSSSSSSSSGGCPPSADQNRTTVFNYNADGNRATLTVWNAETGNQTTTYVYGTTLSDSAIATSTLLRRVKYPDSTGESDSVESKYNRQSQRTEIEDQRGCVRTLDFDLLGRQTQDRVTTLGTGVDGTVRRLAVSYEVRGLLEKLTSHDNAIVGQGGIVNEVRLAYNGFGQLTTSWQSHSGAVNTSTTPNVQYAYADGSANTVRPVSMTYPNGRVITYSYGTAAGTDDAASRILALVDSDAASTHLAEYQYLGLGSVVEVDYTEPDLRYRLFDPAASGDIYTGLDRFGRVIDCRWHDYGSSTDAVRIKYGYDRASNRTWREDAVAASLGKHFDELYAYDGLHRLKDMQRGQLNAQKTAVTNMQFAQCWSLDETGNWSGFRSDDEGDGTWNLIQDRTANPVNEITAITKTAGPAWATPAYDPAGNMTTIPQPVDPTTSYTATYDAWNRLVKLVDAATSNTVQENAYDPRRFRTVREDYAGGTLSETRHFYYTDGWQSVEERLGSSTAPEQQHVWGLRYIDDLVLRDRDTTDNGVLDERLYAFQDGNRNVTAVADENGDVQERYSYAAYGEPFILSPAFSGRSHSDFVWDTSFAGYCWDSGTKLFAVRNRQLHAVLGSWTTRDPLKFASFINLYCYTHNHPTAHTDPYGLQDVWTDPYTMEELARRRGLSDLSMKELLRKQEQRRYSYEVTWWMYCRHHSRVREQIQQTPLLQQLFYGPEQYRPRTVLSQGCVGITQCMLGRSISNDITTDFKYCFKTFSDAQNEQKKWNKRSICCGKNLKGKSAEAKIFAFRWNEVELDPGQTPCTTEPETGRIVWNDTRPLRTAPGAFDFGFYDEAWDGWWHATVSEDGGSVILLSTLEKFTSGKRTTVFCVACESRRHLKVMPWLRSNTSEPQAT